MALPDSFWADPRPAKTKPPKELDYIIGGNNDGWPCITGDPTHFYANNPCGEIPLPKAPCSLHDEVFFTLSEEVIKTLKLTTINSRDPIPFQSEYQPPVQWNDTLSALDTDE